MDQLGPAFGIEADSRLVSHLVVQAATVDAAGVAQPVVIMTGRDVYQKPLPKWIYAADDQDMHRLVKLVTDMAEMAMRRASEQRAEAGL